MSNSSILLHPPIKHLMPVRTAKTKKVMKNFQDLVNVKVASAQKALASEKSIESGKAHNALVELDNVSINTARGARALVGYMQIWDALKVINASCKACTESEKSEFTEIKTATTAPAQDLANLQRLLDLKKFKGENMLFFDFLNADGSYDLDILGEEKFHADTLEGLVAQSRYIEGKSVLCYVKKERDGKKADGSEKWFYYAVPLGRGGLYRIQDVAKAIFSRYAEEIKAFNKNIVDVLKKGDKNALENGNKYGTCVGDFSKVVRRDYVQALNKLAKDENRSDAQKAAELFAQKLEDARIASKVVRTFQVVEKFDGGYVASSKVVTKEEVSETENLFAMDNSMSIAM